MNRRIWLAATAIVSTLGVSSCTSIDVSELPQPGGSYRDGYDVVIEFDNVLNLPDRAKVVMDGTTVGVVTKVAGTSRQVDVTSRIDSSVVVPSNIHASLEQATVLGDIYVAFDRPESDNAAEPPLGAGARIPLARTTSPPQLEDTIAHLANFVSSGSIQRVQNTIIGINRLAPQGEGAIRKLASQVAADLSDLSENIDLVDKWLNGVSGTAAVMHAHIPTFTEWFSPKGLEGFSRMTTTAKYTGTILPSVGTVYSGGYWLVPFLHSLAEAMGAVQQSKWTFEEEWPAWRELFTDYFLPQDKYPAINITSILGSDGRELSHNVQDVLRILGATP